MDRAITIADLPHAIVFDCDGVLLASNRLKTAVFCEVLEHCGFHEKDVSRFKRFQTANFGMSRYSLFETLLTWRDLQCRPAVGKDDLVASYGERLYHRYVRCASTPGMRSILAELNARAIPLFVVSGSDEAELRKVFAERELGRYFSGIFGSPRNKLDNLQLVAQALGMELPLANVVFVGDAEADFRAASAAGARFVYMDHFSTAKSRMRHLQQETGFPMIQDLRALPIVLQDLPRHA